jgi:hypothetical protein
VADGRRLERRGRDEREQVREARERVRRRAERGVEPVLRLGEVEPELGRPRAEPLEEPVDVQAVAGVGRDAPRGRVRTVEGAAAIPSRSTSVFEPTGAPVAAYASTTRARMSSCRGVNSTVAWCAVTSNEA